MLGAPGDDAARREGPMLETVIVVLLVLWLLGYFGRTRLPRLRGGGGNLIHLLLVIILVLIVVRLLR
jgi:uncharacterized protein DUF5670